ncbi:bacterioferritin [Aliikangiella coralliicola]|uniref:Bacterioferritin n=1 Tax=Aliikangiella coralliicola TaxID=2592383 RepID=A0A545U8N8_9GAMM|nr:bacterioferritin [Aliikangiella coralliicola]TQV85831.1 bacterioferritin [Aliikangiella coralliicola]
MQGNQKVIEQLQKLLESELSAFDQYFIHARMYGDWDLSKLEERISHEAEEEREHAQLLIDRMLFLEAKPDLSKRTGLNIGSTVPEMLKSDLDYELKVAEMLRDAINVCEQEQDYQSRQILLKLLADTEEDHMYWLEQQLGLIDKMGLENYIQSQM